MSKKTLFRIRRAIGIVALVLGIYFMVAYLAKTLPFGIASNNIGLLGLWAYTGWFVSIVVITYGMMMVFSRQLCEFLKKLERGEI